MWNFERCLASALNYQTRGEWAALGGGAYQAARRRGWLDQCADHMKPVRRDIATLDQCIDSASKYASRKAWKTSEDARFYSRARRMGWLDECLPVGNQSARTKQITIFGKVCESVGSAFEAFGFDRSSSVGRDVAELGITTVEAMERRFVRAMHCQALAEDESRYPDEYHRKNILLLSRPIVNQETNALLRISARISERQKTCSNCGIGYLRSATSRWSRCCSQDCRDSRSVNAKEMYRSSEAGRSAIRAAKSRRKAIMRGSNGADRIDPIKVFERDKWRCHLCGIKTMTNLRGTTHDRAPELEHIVSLADGGTHTWGNVACSCRKCNQTKGAKSFGQLGLSFAA